MASATNSSEFCFFIIDLEPYKHESYAANIIKILELFNKLDCWYFGVYIQEFKLRVGFRSKTQINGPLRKIWSVHNVLLYLDENCPFSIVTGEYIMLL